MVDFLIIYKEFRGNGIESYRYKLYDSLEMIL